MTLLTELIDTVFDGQKQAEDSVLNTNLYAEGSGYSEGELPYFWLLLGHQETLFPLTQALGLTRAAKLPFASSYFFEFLTKEDGSDYVKTVFRDDQGQTTDVKLACSVSDSDNACEKSAFKSFIAERLALAESVDCDSDYPTDVKHTYADIDKFTTQLLEDIGLPVDNDEQTPLAEEIEHSHPVADVILASLDSFEKLFTDLFAASEETETEDLEITQ